MKTPRTLAALGGAFALTLGILAVSEVPASAHNATVTCPTPGTIRQTNDYPTDLTIHYSNAVGPVLNSMVPGVSQPGNTTVTTIPYPTGNGGLASRWYATWPDGFRQPSTGTNPIPGTCLPPTTTTTVPATTTTVTDSSTSTEAGTTSTSGAPTTTTSTPVTPQRPATSTTITFPTTVPGPTCTTLVTAPEAPPLLTPQCPTTTTVEATTTTTLVGDATDTDTTAVRITGSTEYVGTLAKTGPSRGGTGLRLPVLLTLVGLALVLAGRRSARAMD